MKRFITLLALLGLLYAGIRWYEYTETTSINTTDIFQVYDGSNTKTVTFLTIKSQVIDSLPYCELFADSTIERTITSANTYELLQDEHFRGNGCFKFCADSSRMVYEDTISRVLRFSGTAQVECDKLDTLTFGMFRNDSLILYRDTLGIENTAGFDKRVTSKIGIPKVNSATSIGITSILEFRENDTVTVKIKTAKDNSTVKINNMQVTVK